MRRPLLRYGREQHQLLVPVAREAIAFFIGCRKSAFDADKLLARRIYDKHFVCRDIDPAQIGHVAEVDLRKIGQPQLLVLREQLPKLLLGNRRKRDQVRLKRLQVPVLVFRCFQIRDRFQHRLPAVLNVGEQLHYLRLRAVTNGLQYFAVANRSKRMNDVIGLISNKVIVVVSNKWFAHGRQPLIVSMESK